MVRRWCVVAFSTKCAAKSRMTSSGSKHFGNNARDAAEKLGGERRDGYRSKAPTARYVAVDRADLQYRHVSAFANAGDACEAARDVIDDTSKLCECGGARAHEGRPEVVWCSGSKHMLNSCYWQQHAISRSSAEAELHEFVHGTARGLFIRSVLQAMEPKRTACGNRLECISWDHSKAVRREVTSGGQGLVDTILGKVA